MSSSDLRSLAESLRGHIFVDGRAIDAILKDRAEGKITESEALARLRNLQYGAQEGPFQLSAREVDKEWAALLEAMAEESLEWHRVAKSQFRQGFYILPVAIVFVLAVLLLASWMFPASTLAVASLLGACLVAVGAHAFFVLRVHQQARLAVERLSEKRAAILFLRLALGRTNPEEAAQILNAGTAMFLGHHAATAIPLQPNDFPRK